MLGVLDGSVTLDDADRYVPCKFTPSDGNITTIQNSVDSASIQSNVISANIVTQINATSADISGLETIIHANSISAGDTETIVNQINSTSAFDNSLTIVNQINLTSASESNIVDQINATSADISGLETIIHANDLSASYNDITVSDIFAGVVDSVTVEEILTNLLSWSTGKIERVGDNFTYFKQDNLTSAFSLSGSPAERIRS